LNTLVAGVGRDSEGWGVLAVSLDTSVRIDLLEFNTFLGGVLHGNVWPAAVATFAVLSAINELLFREGEEDGVVEEIETFEGSSGGESPA